MKIHANTEGPRHDHDCKQCEFLGRSAAGLADLYICDNRFSTLIARFSSTGQDYASAPRETVEQWWRTGYRPSTPALLDALGMARYRKRPLLGEPIAAVGHPDGAVVAQILDIDRGLVLESRQGNVIHVARVGDKLVRTHAHGWCIRVLPKDEPDALPMFVSTDNGSALTTVLGDVWVYEVMTDALLANFTIQRTIAAWGLTGDVRPYDSALQWLAVPSDAGAW